MQSLVVLLVDHGETTDPLEGLIADAYMAKGASVFNYDMAVDVTDEEASYFFPGDLLATIIGRNNKPAKSAPLAPWEVCLLSHPAECVCMGEKKV